MADYRGVAMALRDRIRVDNKTGRPPIVKVGARETGLMGKVATAANRGNLWLQAMGMECTIDEVAIMLPQGHPQDTDWLQCMLGRVGKEGVTYFNHSRSAVNVNSLPSRYNVEYHFFTTSVPGVRLEVMDLKDGYSPLHALYNVPEAQRGRDACVVHASFKVPDEAAYRVTLADLQATGWVCGQDCSSDYGLFSYWRQPEDTESLLWLKPRVNLRDGGRKPVLFSPEDQGTDFQYSDFDAEQDEDDDPEEDYDV